MATCRRSSCRTSSRIAGITARRWLISPTRPRERFWRPGLRERPSRRHAGLGDARSRWRRWSDLVGDGAWLLPGVGVQVPPNLADWWPELVAAGATDLGGLSANGDHISPEHPFPSPHQVRKRLQGDGVALTERLCVYPQYLDADWVAQGVLDVVKARYWTFIPRRGSGRQEPPFADPRRAGRPGASSAPATAAGSPTRRSRRCSARRARRRSRRSARPPTSCAPSSRARR